MAYKSIVVKLLKINFIFGDNLGIYSIGGLLEISVCPSSSAYIAKFTGQIFRVKTFFPRRTVESHTEAIAKLNKEPNLKSYRGLKFDSIFNNLHLYYSSKRLPLCHDHDLFKE